MTPNKRTFDRSGLIVLVLYVTCMSLMWGGVATGHNTVALAGVALAAALTVWIWVWLARA